MADLNFVINGVPDMLATAIQKDLSEKFKIEANGVFVLNVINPHTLKIESADEAQAAIKNLQLSKKIIEFAADGVALFTAQELLKTNTLEEADAIASELLKEVG